jgi:AcrR family transcriptional regulator
VVTDVKRTYSSPKREEAARATRAAVIAAAAALFAERGYGSTSIEDVAARAGVSRATVFNSVGGKPALMRAAHRTAIAGEDHPRPAREGPLGERLKGVSGAAAILDVYAAALTDVFESVGPLQVALERASSEAQELGDMLTELEHDRRVGAGNIIAMIADELPAGLTAERATDILWVHNDPSLWQSLHGARGWTKAEFCSWLAITFRRQLLEG